MQDAVRGDYMEVAALLQKNGGKVHIILDGNW